MKYIPAQQYGKSEQNNMIDFIVSVLLVQCANSTNKLIGKNGSRIFKNNIYTLLFGFSINS